MSERQFAKIIARMLEAARKRAAKLEALKRGELVPVAVQVRGYRVRSYRVAPHVRVIATKVRA